MEKPAAGLNVGQGLARLPPGFRFHPTDEELVVQYLKRKVFACPLPASIIPEIDLGKYNPWDLPGASEQERYFFNLREAKYPNGSRRNRATSSGYWKATGRDREIVASSRCNQVVGMKKVLVFYQGKPSNGIRTDWVMHEYRLASTETRACVCPQRKNSIHTSMVPAKDWVLCRIYMKKRAAKMDVEIDEACNDARASKSIARFIDFMGQSDRHRSPSRSSSSLSDSSCVTELSDGSSSGEESYSSMDATPPGRVP